MPKFEHIKKKKVRPGTTAKYSIPEIAVNGHTPVLIVAPASEINAPYYNELLRTTGASARRARSGAITTELLGSTRETDRELYALHVIKGWESVYDDDGEKEVKFTVEVAKELLEAFPDWIFDELRAFCMSTANFVDDASMYSEDVAKN